MAYDTNLEGRIRALLAAEAGVVEKRMFGGMAFMVQGNLACGVHGGNLIVRVGPGAHAAAMTKPHAKPFDLTGRPMNGWVEVLPEGVQSEAVLKEWVFSGVFFARSLPAK